MNTVNEYPTDKYEELEELISFEGFGFDARTYRRQEVELLQPQLAALGYTDIEWLPGETDTWGPLTRVCKATKDGVTVWFSYG